MVKNGVEGGSAPAYLLLKLKTIKSRTPPHLPKFICRCNHQGTTIRYVLCNFCRFLRNLSLLLLKEGEKTSFLCSDENTKKEKSAFLFMWYRSVVRSLSSHVATAVGRCRQTAALSALFSQDVRRIAKISVLHIQSYRDLFLKIKQDRLFWLTWHEGASRLPPTSPCHHRPVSRLEQLPS